MRVICFTLHRGLYSPDCYLYSRSASRLGLTSNFAYVGFLNVDFELFLESAYYLLGYNVRYDVFFNLFIFKILYYI